MKKTSVRMALDAFQKGDYQAALLMYRRLAEKLGRESFSANIAMCEQRIVQSPGTQDVTSPHLGVDLIHPNPPGHHGTGSFAQHGVYFPQTGQKLKAHARETILRRNSEIPSLATLFSEHRYSTPNLMEGIIEGLELRSLTEKKPTLLVAGHDLRFAQPLIDCFREYFSVVIDAWVSASKHNFEVSSELLRRADIIWCEWCCGNAVWYSEHVSARQRLFIRLHKFEIETAYPSRVNWDNVSSLIFIAPGMRTFANSSHRLDCRQYVLHNGFDVDAVRSASRARHDTFALAFVGFIPYIKRLDKALDFYEQAWKANRRFSLHLKSKSPQDVPWVWKKEHRYFEEQAARISQLRRVGASVTQQPYDDQVHAWLGQKGFILSSSDIEGSHQAVAEAMACGTVPIIFGEWVDHYAARYLYPSEFCFKSMEHALSYLHRLTNDVAEYEETSRRCMDFAHENFNHYGIAHGAVSIMAGNTPPLRYMPIASRKRVVVFSDLCINVIDGSSVWLTSIVELLLEDPNLDVVLVSRERCRRPGLLDDFYSTNRFLLEVFDNTYSEVKAEEFVCFLADVLEKHKPARAILRVTPSIADKILKLVPDKHHASLIYYLIGEAYPSDRFLDSIGTILVQTEESRRRLFDKHPSWSECKDVRILPPMIPTWMEANIVPPHETINVAYTGKLSKGYMALEMMKFANRAPRDVMFVICAAKFLKVDGDDYIASVRKEIAAAVGKGNTLFLEGMTRDNTMQISTLGHVGWSIRDRTFSDTSEVSTKVLEYCSIGKPVLLNKFPSNVALLGDDYPLYIESPEAAMPMLSMLKNDERLYAQIADHCVQAVRDYKMDRVYSDIADLFFE